MSMVFFFVFIENGEDTMSSREIVEPIHKSMEHETKIWKQRARAVESEHWNNMVVAVEAQIKGRVLSQSYVLREKIKDEELKWLCSRLKYENL